MVLTMYVVLSQYEYQVNTANTCKGSPPARMAMLDSIHGLCSVEHREIWVRDSHLGRANDSIRTTSLYGLVCRGLLPCLHWLHKMFDPSLLSTSDQGHLQHALEVRYLDCNYLHRSILSRLHLPSHILVLPNSGILEVIQPVLEGRFPLHQLKILKRPIGRNEYCQRSLFGPVALHHASQVRRATPTENRSEHHLLSGVDCRCSRFSANLLPREGRPQRRSNMGWFRCPSLGPARDTAIAHLRQCTCTARVFPNIPQQPTPCILLGSQ